MIAVQVSPGQVYWMRLEKGAVQVLCGETTLTIGSRETSYYPLHFAGYPAAKAWGRTYAERPEFSWRLIEESRLAREQFRPDDLQRVLEALKENRGELRL